MASVWSHRLRNFLGRRPAALRLHYAKDYRRLVKHLMATLPLDEAMERAVGGGFQRFGMLQRQLLVQLGLQPHHAIIDVGCGSGRLATALRDYLAKGSYLGTDVVPELLDYARAKCPAHWQFRHVEEIAIPASAASADFVVFFSVFTHLLQHESYVYLTEASQAVKPGGRVVFSFLEFPHHWKVFEDTVTSFRAGHRLQHLNEFIGREAIREWSARLGMPIAALHAGTEAFIEHAGERHVFGQSVCVLQKPA